MRSRRAARGSARPLNCTLGAMANRSDTSGDESARATALLTGKVVSFVQRQTERTVLIQFEDGTRLFVDAVATGLDLSITE
jgi:hypothetical protein